MMNTAHPLVYENAFDDDVSDDDKRTKILTDCLSKLNRDEAIIKCCEINFALFRGSDKIDEQLISANFAYQSIKRINWFIGKHKKKHPNANFIAFWRGQMTDMIFYILQYCPTDKGYKLTDAEFNKNFSKSALLTGELLNEKYTNTGNLFNDSIEALPVLKRCLVASNHISSSHMYNLIYRGYNIFINLLGKTKINKALEETYAQRFFNYYKISLDDCYIYFLFFLWHQCISSSKNYTFITELLLENVTRKEIREDIKLGVNLLTITPDQLIDKLTNEQGDKKLTFKRLLREKPIICLSNSISLISDVTYVMDDFLSKGILFRLSKIQRKKENVYAVYGDCFESYVSELLKQRHKKSLVLLRHRLSPQNHDPLEVDAFVDLSDIKIIYEIKAVLINESENYNREIKRKYYKAIEQIANKINFFKNDDNPPTIYPILIVEDRYIAASQFLLQSKLEEQLIDQQKNIRPLIVISVETLELLPVTVDLFSIFKEYHEGKFTINNTGANFRNFILSTHYKHGTYTSPQTLDLIKYLLNQSGEKMFYNYNENINVYGN